jgi:hypothetical protein
VTEAIAAFKKAHFNFGSGNGGASGRAYNCRIYFITYKVLDALKEGWVELISIALIVWMKIQHIFLSESKIIYSTKVFTYIYRMSELIPSIAKLPRGLV